MEKKFDICIMNPPYGKNGSGIHNIFLRKALDISKQIVTVQPLTWLLSINQPKNITSIIDECGIDIESINTRDFFDAEIVGNIAIQYINTETKNKIMFNGDEFDKCSDIKQYSNDKALVEFSKCINYVDTVADSLCDHLNEKHKFYIEIAKIRGHKSPTGNNVDFYTIISNNDSWLRKNKIGKFNGEIGNIKFYSFETEIELDNFIRYIKTDFVRSCLMLTKINMNLFCGRPLRSIPWQDFSDKVFNQSPKEIDDYLFKKYNISDEIRKHIEEILPDYYEIRK